MTMRKKDLHSGKIRLAIIVTALTLAPSALGLGVFLKHNVIKQHEKVDSTADATPTTMERLEKAAQQTGDSTLQL